MKKEKKNLIMGLFIILIMISSTLGFIYSGEDVKKYNGYKFQKTDQGWATFIKKSNSYQTFVYLPNEVEDLEDVELNSDFFYIVNNNDIYYGNKLRNFLTSAGIVSQFASFYENTTLSKVNCSESFPIIVLEKSSSDGSYDVDIKNQENCVYINGNLNKGIDFLAYIIFGVIKKDG